MLDSYAYAVYGYFTRQPLNRVIVEYLVMTESQCESK